MLIRHKAFSACQRFELHIQIAAGVVEWRIKLNLQVLALLLTRDRNVAIEYLCPITFFKDADVIVIVRDQVGAVGLLHIDSCRERKFVLSLTIILHLHRYEAYVFLLDFVLHIETLCL